MGRSGLLQYCSHILVQCLTYKLSRESSYYQLTKRALEQFGLSKGISIENAAYKPRGSVFKSLNHIHTHTHTHTHKTCWTNFLWLNPRISVHNEVLLPSLHFYDIKGTGADWFAPCLTDRNLKSLNHICQ
jgi:hypothetical protein